MTNGGLWESNLEKWLDGKGAGVLDSMGRNVDPRLYNQVRLCRSTSQPLSLSYLPHQGRYFLSSLALSLFAIPRCVRWSMQIQATVLNSSRHGIGAIFGEECQHGVQGDHHTIFPSPYTVAAAFDRDLMLAIGRVIATEARAGGTSQCWAPVCGVSAPFPRSCNCSPELAGGCTQTFSPFPVSLTFLRHTHVRARTHARDLPLSCFRLQVAREPRWGRSEEEMSEDTFLAGELAANMVKGMTADGGDLDTDDTVAPLLKHYAAYSIPGDSPADVHFYCVPYTA